jgi:S1-C subfamily serine protease
MSERQWYVRMRGRVIGPLQMQQLRALRDRGQFRSFHEVSEDRQAWRPASTLTEVFATTAIEEQAKQETCGVADLAPLPPEADARQPIAAWYYAAADGKREGPVSEDQLIAMWSQGAITAMTLVWKDGLRNWLPISATELASRPTGATFASKPKRGLQPVRMLLGVLALIGLVMCGAGGYLYWRGTRPISAVIGRDDDFADAIGMVVGGLQVTAPDGTQEDVCWSQGSSFAASADGYFLTNKHVISRVWQAMHAQALIEKIRKEELFVIKPSVWVFLKGKKFGAEVIHVSDNDDFAILKITHHGSYFCLGGSTEVQRGAKIAACGFPATSMEPLSLEEFVKHKLRQVSATRVEQRYKPRDFEYVQTTGTVSRVMSDEGNRERWIQHTATINPGNSGGPLIQEEDARVVGINTLSDEKGTFVSLAVYQLREQIDKFVPNVAWK